MQVKEVQRFQNCSISSDQWEKVYSLVYYFSFLVFFLILTWGYIERERERHRCERETSIDRSPVWTCVWGNAPTRGHQPGDKDFFKTVSQQSPSIPLKYPFCSKSSFCLWGKIHRRQVHHFDHLNGYCTVVSLVSTLLNNLHHCLIPGHFITPKNPVPIKQSLPISSFPVFIGVLRSFIFVENQTFWMLYIVCQLWKLDSPPSSKLVIDARIYCLFG